MTVRIPDKLYFKIGEVAELTGVRPHVLRYWESEFAPFRPAKSRSQQRLYRRKDIELVLLLKDLLYSQGFTISGAKKKLREQFAQSLSAPPQSDESVSERQLLQDVRRDLQRLRDSLDL